MNEHELILKLKVAVRAYKLSDRYDHCPDEIAEYSGMRPDEVVDCICRMVEEG